MFCMQTSRRGLFPLNHGQTGKQDEHHQRQEPAFEQVRLVAGGECPEQPWKYHQGSPERDLAGSVRVPLAAQLRSSESLRSLLDCRGSYAQEASPVNRTIRGQSQRYSVPGLPQNGTRPQPAIGARQGVKWRVGSCASYLSLETWSERARSMGRAACSDGRPTSRQGGHPNGYPSG